MKSKLIALCLACLLAIAGFAARKFDGTNSQYVNTNANVTGYGSATTISVSFWLWVDSYGSSDKLVMESSANYNAHNGAWIVDSGGVAGGCSNAFYFAFDTLNHFPSTPDSRARSFTQPSSAAWHQFVLVMVANSGSGWAAYVDGVSQSLNTCDSGSPINTQNFAADDTFLYLMSRHQNTLNLAGRMTQVAIYNRALTANEAVSLAAGREPIGVATDSLIGYWPLYGDSGAVSGVEPDLSGHGNPATAQGSTLANNPPITPGAATH